MEFAIVRMPAEGFSSPRPKLKAKDVIARQVIAATDVNDDGAVATILNSLPDKMVKKIVEMRVDPQRSYTIGMTTPLHHASLHGNLKIVRALLSSCKKNPSLGIDPNIYLPYMYQHILPFAQHWAANSTPLHFASSRGHTEIVGDLIRMNANPNSLDANGNAPIILAAKNGHEDTVKALIEFGAIPHLPNIELQTALHHAVVPGHMGVIKVLLSGVAGEEIAQTFSRKQTERVQDTRNAYFLKDMKAETTPVNQQDAYGYSPFMHAIRYSNTNSAKYLCAFDVDFSLRDKKGLSAVHLSAQNGLVEFLKHLLSNFMVSTNHQDNRGNTPLHLAAMYGETEAAKVLMDHDANKDAQNKKGNTPLLLAVTEGHATTAKELIILGANTELPNYVGIKPIDAAKDHGLLHLFEKGYEDLDASSHVSINARETPVEGVTGNCDGKEAKDSKNHSHKCKETGNVLDDSGCEFNKKQQTQAMERASYKMDVSKQGELVPKLLCVVSDSIANDWRFLFRTLMSKFDHEMDVEASIECIEYDYTRQLREQAYQALMKWKHCCGEESSHIKYILEALSECQRKDIVQNVEKLLECDAE